MTDDNLADLDPIDCQSPMAHGVHPVVVHQEGDVPDKRFRCSGREVDAE